MWHLILPSIVLLKISIENAQNKYTKAWLESRVTCFQIKHRHGLVYFKNKEMENWIKTMVQNVKHAWNYKSQQCLDKVRTTEVCINMETRTDLSSTGWVSDRWWWWWWWKVVMGHNHSVCFVSTSLWDMFCFLLFNSIKTNYIYCYIKPVNNLSNVEQLWQNNTLTTTVKTRPVSYLKQPTLKEPYMLHISKPSTVIILSFVWVISPSHLKA